MDLAVNSQVDTANFELISPGIRWPEKVDLIWSSYSYMWHYPMEEYWNQIQPYAAKGCKLSFDILNRAETDYVKDISDLTGRQAKCSPKPYPLYHYFEKELVNVNGSCGQTAYWG
jgi:hypothetical protein